MSSLKPRRYEIGGFSGDQLEPLVDAMIREADEHWLGREPLREIVAALSAKFQPPPAEGVQETLRKAQEIAEAIRSRYCTGNYSDGTSIYTFELSDKEAVAVIAAALNGEAEPPGPAPQGWQSIETAPKDGLAVLGYGLHSGPHPDAQRGVKAGDHWWAIMLWDIWRASDAGGCGEQSKWVLAKDGKPTWSYPTHWMPLPAPPGEPGPDHWSTSERADLIAEIDAVRAELAELRKQSEDLRQQATDRRHRETPERMP